MQKIVPFLWFDGRGAEAMAFYAGIFPNSRVKDAMYWGDTGPGPKGALLSATFELQGQEFAVLNGGPQYQFTPAISFFVHCESQQEIDRYWSKLTAGGQEVQCGWVTDKFGVSWQIVPTVLGPMLRDKNAARANRVMTAMMSMVKLDIAALQQAYDSGG